MISVIVNAVMCCVRIVTKISSVVELVRIVRGHKKK